MAEIIQLDDELANKIAAGEVVERPASVVKELLENAIDANSSRILLEVEEGGLTSIRVVDNGDGMDAIDAEAAFLRHATSKIKTDRDLFQITTLGFRGEALPSIASVSHVKLTTSTGEQEGVELALEGGDIVAKHPAPVRKGTDIVVTNLFYNTPARLKYLKTVQTEMGHISDIVNRIALAHPDVSFECYHNGKEFLRTPGNGDRRHVIAAIYGRETAKKMKVVASESHDFKLEGFVALPEVNRASRQYISLFVNGRFIRNIALTRAILDAYHTLLPIGRYPVCVLSLTMDPTLVDVNVHPTKLEVRFSKEDELKAFITTAIQAVFKKETLIPAAEMKKKPPREKAEQLPLRFEERVVEPSKQTTRPILETSPSTTLKPVIRERTAELKLTREDEQKRDEREESSRQNAHEERLPTLYPIGQLHGTYIVAQDETGMYLIDQHAAQERIKYEYFKEKVGDVSADHQQLLIPITLECTAQEAAIIHEHIDELHQVGIFPEAFGPQSFIIRSHPTWFPKGDEEETIREIIDYLLAHRKVDIKKLREKAAILMACKAAIKANRYLRQDEMIALLDALKRCNDPFTCPHGRPILVHFSTYEIEKMFKRVM